MCLGPGVHVGVASGQVSVIVWVLGTKPVGHRDLKTVVYTVVKPGIMAGQVGQYVTVMPLVTVIIVSGSSEGQVSAVIVVVDVLRP